MLDLLEKDSIVIASKYELLKLCTKYQIPNINIEVEIKGYRDLTKYPFVISKDGIRNYEDDVSPESNVFKNIEALEYYLFLRAISKNKVIVYKETYHTYLKTIKILKKLGFKVIRDKTYYEEADSFYFFCGYFKEISHFGCKCVVSVYKGIGFKGIDFLNILNRYYKNKDRYKRDISYYQSEILGK